MALFKKKDKDTKKGGENTIGKIIYGFLLFAPLFSIATRCLYVIFNKNAYESYYGQNINEQQVINTNELKTDIEYTYNYTDTQVQNKIGPNNISINSFELIYTNNSTWQQNINNIASKINNINFYINVGANNQQNLQLFYLDNNNTQQSYIISLFNDLTSIGYISFKFVPITNYTITNTNADLMFSYIEYNKYSYLDNSFEYSINQTENSNIYNWAKETGTYTVLQNATTGLGITNEFIPMLMAYWLIISVIYFLFDIALILIWAVHKKIHELTEAI